MDPILSDVSNEATVLSSFDSLFPRAVLRVCIISIFVVATTVFALRATSLAKVTADLHRLRCRVECIYYHSVEAGLLTPSCNEAIHGDLQRYVPEFIPTNLDSVPVCRLQLKASSLREESLRASLTYWGGICAYCRGLSFELMRCTEEVRILKIRIEVRQFRFQEVYSEHEFDAPLDIA
jgi:hypothetical protein